MDVQPDAARLRADAGWEIAKMLDHWQNRRWMSGHTDATAGLHNLANGHINAGLMNLALVF